MARSTYIYLLSFNGQPVAAFTVKYELVKYLKNLLDDIIFKHEINDEINWKVERFIDNKPETAIVDISEEIAKEL